MLIVEKKMLLDNLFKSSRYYRIINEIPAAFININTYNGNY